MRPLLKTLLAAAALSASVFAVQAQMNPAPAGATSTPQVDARQAQQQARIAQGTASGALTPRERLRLQREQRAIRHAEVQAKADGVVTPRERRHLARMQAKASRDIHRQKHDAQHLPTRPATTPR